MSKTISDEALEIPDRDKRDLIRYGKKQELRRNFGLMSTVALCCTLTDQWEVSLIALSGGLTNGGPSGLLWGYIFAWMGSIAQALVMAELGSMIPLAGGQLDWVAYLAPPRFASILSYIAGWIMVIGWQAIVATASLNCGQMIQGAVVLYHSEYKPERWQAVLFSHAIIWLALGINRFLARILPKLDVAVLIIHLLGFVAVLVPLAILAPKVDASAVFHNFVNNGGWQSDGLSFFVGSATTMYAFIGIDAANHMAEEIENAPIIIPCAMLFTVTFNGLLGFGMLILVLFCLNDLSAALVSPTGFPFMHIFLEATQSRVTTAILTLMILLVSVVSTVNVMASASRTTWAFARAQGLPFHKHLAHVSSSHKLPLRALFLTAIISLLQVLLKAVSVVAFNALTGLVIASFYAAFILAALVLVIAPQHNIRWGPFQLGHRFRNPIYVIAILYSLLGFFFSFWPPIATPGPTEMNWSVFVFLGVLLLAWVYWRGWARRVFMANIDLDGVSRLVACIEEKGLGT